MDLHAMQARRESSLCAGAGPGSRAFLQGQGQLQAPVAGPAPARQAPARQAAPLRAATVRPRAGRLPPCAGCPALQPPAQTVF